MVLQGMINGNALGVHLLQNRRFVRVSAISIAGIQNGLGLIQPGHLRIGLVEFHGKLFVHQVIRRSRNFHRLPFRKGKVLVHMPARDIPGKHGPQEDNKPDMVHIGPPAAEPVFFRHQGLSVSLHMHLVAFSFQSGGCVLDPYGSGRRILLPGKRSGIREPLAPDKLGMLAELLPVKRTVQGQHPVQTADDQGCADHHDKRDKPPGFVCMGEAQLVINPSDNAIGFLVINCRVLVDKGIFLGKYRSKSSKQQSCSNQPNSHLD
ncbi:hypothetical protein D3C75_796230 [compost metagenome]